MINGFRTQEDNQETNILDEVFCQSQDWEQLPVELNGSFLLAFQRPVVQASDNQQTLLASEDSNKGQSTTLEKQSLADAEKESNQKKDALMEKRRNRNRKLARESRERKKEELKGLKERVATLENEKVTLIAQLVVLNEENERLKETIKETIKEIASLNQQEEIKIQQDTEKSVSMLISDNCALQQTIFRLNASINNLQHQLHVRTVQNNDLFQAFSNSVERIQLLEKEVARLQGKQQQEVRVLPLMNNSQQQVGPTLHMYEQIRQQRGRSANAEAGDNPDATFDAEKSGSYPQLKA